MSKSEPRWIVKDPQGRIYGPLNTQEVLRQIDQGYFVGGELIASYPGGKWIPISKAPDFYDRLLDVLSAEEAEHKAKRVRSDGKSPHSSDLYEETVIASVDPKPTEPVENEIRETTEPEITVEKTRKTERSKTKSNDDVIELSDLKSLAKAERLKKAKAPLALVAVGILAVAVVALWPSRQNAGRVRLLAPRSKQPPLADKEIRERFKRGLAAFQLDTHSGYLKAQNEFVQIVEGSPRFLDVRSMLCMTYREIWPFAIQDAADQNTIAFVARETRSLDPVGHHGVLCDLVQNLTLLRLDVASQSAESGLTRFPEAPIFFYDVIAEVAMVKKNYSIAGSYYSTIRKLWTPWAKSYVNEARAAVFDKRIQEALDLYEQALKVSPHHEVARAEMGILEFEEYRQADKAFDLLKTALESGEKLPRQVEANAHLSLAQILDSRGQSGKALEAAKKAYALIPDNPKAMEIIRRLGGGSAALPEPGYLEQLYLCEQYHRQGDHFAAQAACKVAFEQNNSSGQAATIAAKSLWELSQSQEAIDWLKKAIKADPNLVNAYVTLADYYSQRFDYLSAVGVLKQIQAREPKSHEVWRGFALVELRRNNFKAAKSFSERALQYYDGDSESNLILAKANLGMENYQDALKFVDKAIEMDIQNSQAQSLKGRILVGLRGIDAGVEFLQKLALDYQKVFEYQLTLGDIFITDRRFKEAEATFGRVLSLDQKNKRAMIGMGRAILAQKERPTDALKIFLEAAVLDPSDAHAIYYAGLAYVEQKRYSEAANQFQRVIKINNRFPGARVSLGRAYLVQGDASTALQNATAEKAVNPELADAYILAAEAYYFQGAFAQCANELQLALGKGAKNSETYVKLARCYRKSGALESAVSVLRQGTSYEKGYADFYKEQGAVYQLKGMANEAVQAYDLYKALNPNGRDIYIIDQQIRKCLAGDFTLDEREF